MYIFISHSSKDASIAEELCNIIEANGSDCFLAPRNIRSGYEYAAEIVDGIDRSDAVLLLLSDSANTSPHILREIERAVSKAIPIIVYKLEEVTLSKSLEYFLMSHQWLNAEKGNQELLIKCINDLKDNTSSAINYTVNSKPKANQKKAPLILGIIAAVAIIACISLAIILLSSKNDDTSQPATTEVPTTHAQENASEEDTTEESTTEESTTASDELTDTNVKLGDTIVFGRYNDADIAWNVIKISEDGTEAVLLAKKILTFKAYTGAENGNFGHDESGAYIALEPEVKTDMELQASIRGNSNWDTSDIRTWLNSSNEYVEYDGHGPISSAMADQRNAYNLEPGFLYNFTKEELSAIKETTVQTKGNSLSDNPTITTTDKVFLLSKEEVEWVRDSKVALFTSPTDEAIAKNESFFYKDYCLDTFKTTACLWWLREPKEDSVSEGYLVSHGAKPDEEFYDSIVAVEEFGIRPAITVDLNSDLIKVKE